jgi:hypothetical protein
LLLTFFGLTVVGVDIGRLAFTAAEVQTVADAAATAGAKAILDERDPDTDARLVASMNKMDGTATASQDLDVRIGRWDFDTSCPTPDTALCGCAFTEGDTPTNVVCAVANRQVTNIWASILGSPATRVTKRAVAAVGPPCSGRPALPLALGDCPGMFPEDCMDDACMPTRTHDSTVDNSAWTGFTDGASQSTILDFFPAPCGGGVESPLISEGDPINITNGQLTPLYNAVQCLVCQEHMTEFLVPVIECPNGNFTQSKAVTGFATVTIERIRFTGSSGGEWRGPATQPDWCAQQGTPDAIEWHSVIRTDPGGGGVGCRNAGTYAVAMVE